MTDITDCRDLTTLQAILCMIVYMQGSGMISRSYTYIVIAISASLRMGFHRAAASANFNPVEREVRKRVFWTLRTMDTYMTTMLGLPRTLNDEDIDQHLPLEVDDKLISPTQIKSVPNHKAAKLSIVNAHTQLIMIKAKIIRHMYPTCKVRPSNGDAYRVSYGRVVGIENALQQWFESAPRVPNSNEPFSQNEIRAHLLLRISYAHVQMVLYRPFLHHISRKELRTQIELRSYACATACVGAAMQVVWLVGQLDTRGLMCTSYWFTPFITSFALTTLYLFALARAGDPIATQAQQKVEDGRKILSIMAARSPIAEWCLSTLNQFDLLRQQLKQPTLEAPYEAYKGTTAGIAPYRPGEGDSYFYGSIPTQAMSSGDQLMNLGGLAQVMPPNPAFATSSFGGQQEGDIDLQHLQAMTYAALSPFPLLNDPSSYFDLQSSEIAQPVPPLTDGGELMWQQFQNLNVPNPNEETMSMNH